MTRVSNMDFYGENTVQEEMEDTTEKQSFWVLKKKRKETGKYKWQNILSDNSKVRESAFLN